MAGKSKAKPVTASEKVAVTVNTPDWGSVALDVSVTVGSVPSVVTLSWVAAALPFVAESCATSAAISTVTSPSATGVTLKV